MIKRNIAYIGMALVMSGCAVNKQATPIENTSGNNELKIAFPGAEGFGRYTTGGRGGKVFIVSNLSDQGEGSLRQAVNAKGARYIVFSVSGTIHLTSPLVIKGDVTIAGQTAPGDGICLADHPVSLGGDNIIIRYMRIRMGDKNQNDGMTAGSGNDDAFGGVRKKHIIIDHCSMSWSTDEVCSVYGGDSTTVQWNIIAEPLNYSYHFEKGDKDYEHHGFGGIMGGRHMSIHHNLFAHCVSRTPRFDGSRNLLPDHEMTDFRNNVIYNWGANNVYGGEGGYYNLVNNYYKYGPSTGKKAREKVFNPYHGKPLLAFGKFYVTGNYVDGSTAVTGNNWLGVSLQGGDAADVATSKVTVPFPFDMTGTQTATHAYRSVIDLAGASFKRDTLDERVINDVKNMTGRIIDVQGGFVHGTAYEHTVNAWPTLQALPPANDTDKDGMPDSFEQKHGLNIHLDDANGHTLHKHYENIEMYFNGLLNSTQH